MAPSLPGLARLQDSLLIMLTSLAPSPMARVTAFLYFFTSSTTWAFCKGVTRQQMTALQAHAVSRNSTSMSASSAWACKESVGTAGDKSRGRQGAQPSPTGPYQAVPVDDQGVFARDGFQHRGELGGGEFLLVGEAVAHGA